MFAVDKKLKILNCLSLDEWTDVEKLQKMCGITNNDLYVRLLEDLSTGGFIDHDKKRLAVQLHLSGSKNVYIRKRNQQIFYYVITSGTFLLALYSALR